MWLLISPEGKFFISRGLPVFNAKPWKFSFVQCFSLYVIKMESHLCALIWKGKSSCLFFQEFPNVLKVTQLWLKLPFIQQLVVTYCVELRDVTNGHHFSKIGITIFLLSWLPLAYQGGYKMIQRKPLNLINWQFQLMVLYSLRYQSSICYISQ